MPKKGTQHSTMLNNSQTSSNKLQETLRTNLAGFKANDQDSNNGQTITT